MEVSSGGASGRIHETQNCKKAALIFSMKLDKIERNMFSFENEISDLWKEYIEDDIQEET